MSFCLTNLSLQLFPAKCPSNYNSEACLLFFPTIITRTLASRVVLCHVKLSRVNSRRIKIRVDLRRRDANRREY
jgi:hypothetical protein